MKRIFVLILSALLNGAFSTSITALEQEQKTHHAKPVKKRKAADQLLPPNKPKKGKILMGSSTDDTLDRDALQELLIVHFPKILADIIIEFAFIECVDGTRGTPIPYVDLNNTLYQRTTDDKEVFVFDANDDNILTMRKYCLYKPTSTWLDRPFPSHWNRTVISNDFYKEGFYKDKDHTTVGLSLENYDDIHEEAPTISVQTSRILSCLACEHITIKQLSSPVVIAAQKQSTLYMAPGMTFQKLAMCLKTMHAYLKRQAQGLPGNQFADISLRYFMHGYQEHANIIEKVAADTTGTLALCWGSDEDYEKLKATQILRKKPQKLRET